MTNAAADVTVLPRFARNFDLDHLSAVRMGPQGAMEAGWSKQGLDAG